MGKKKKEEPKGEDYDEFGDFEESNSDDLEIAFPKIDKKPSETPPSPPPESESETIAEGVEGAPEAEMEEEVEEIVEKPDYKYIKIIINKKEGENDYEIVVKGQSHGFCNVFIKYLLEIEGVNVAAYKVNNIEGSKIFIRLNEGYKLKDVLYKGIESLKNSVLETQKAFQKLM